MRRAPLAALVISAGAAAAIATVVVGWPDRSVVEHPVCVTLTDLTQVMDLSSVRDQAELRARAAELVDALLSHSDDTLSEQQAARIAERISAILADPGATVPDLTVSIEPVAQACEDRLVARSD